MLGALQVAVESMVPNHACSWQCRNSHWQYTAGTGAERRSLCTSLSFRVNFNLLKFVKSCMMSALVVSSSKRTRITRCWQHLELEL